MKVQQLLDSPDKWTRGKFAEDKNRQSVNCESPDAVRWCLTGAIYKCYSMSDERKIVDKIYDETGMFVLIFNDTHTYKEVMELVRRLDL